MYIDKKKYLGFDFKSVYLGEQFSFSLVSFFLEVAQQIQLARAFTTHNLGQVILLGHLKKTIQ
jgi:hypothetical protein